MRVARSTLIESADRFGILQIAGRGRPHVGRPRRQDESTTLAVVSSHRPQIRWSDIVGSTERIAELGDHEWAKLLMRHHPAVRRELDRSRGREIDTAGNGFLAMLDGPARAIRCAVAIREALRDLGLEVRAGLHTGECELLAEKVTGLAVHTGALVAGLAGSGEVLVSSTVRDLVAGSGIAFEDLGVHDLKGVGPRRVFAVPSAPSLGSRASLTESRCHAAGGADADATLTGGHVTARGINRRLPAADCW